MPCLRPAIVKLDSPIQHYAWGSHHAIAQLQGRPAPTDEPEAELWIGDHPVAPSRVLEPSGSTALPDWLSRDPERTLGSGRLHLPFLTKVLAAARALSLQVHPDARQAREGFEREARAGVPEAERCYRDPNAKHELIVALSRFEALCGFRADAEVSRALAALPRAAKCLESRSREAPLAWSLFEGLQGLEETDRHALIDELGTFAGDAEGLEAEWIGRLLIEHPGDPLAVAPLLLNPVVLEPGEALVVRPGTLHTYLCGVGVEVMTRSDNVVRGGLTSKHVERNELARITLPHPQPAERGRPLIGTRDGLEATYETGTDEFAVRTLAIDPDRRVARSGGRVAVLLCVEGRIETDGVALSAGEAALVPAALESYELKGSARTSRVFEVSSH